MTVNGYVDPSIPCALKEVCDYAIYAEEEGESGTPHLQCFVQLKTRHRMLAVKKLVGYDHVHLEPRRGTPEQASEYCKKGGLYEEFGELQSRDAAEGGRRQGKRSKEDWDAWHDAAKKGKFDEIPRDVFIRYQSSFKALYVDERPPDYTYFRGVWIWDRAHGVGKTTHIQKKYKAYMDYNMHNGFFQEDITSYNALVFDEMTPIRGRQVFRELIRFGDMSPIRVNIKHHPAVWWHPEVVFVTSNYRMDEVFGGEDLEKMRKRFPKEIEWTKSPYYKPDEQPKVDELELKL